MAEMVFVLIARGSTEIGTNIRNTAWHKVSKLANEIFCFYRSWAVEFAS